MDIWGILEIAPTNDVDAIKAAYKAKLVTTHPEEKPAEFEALRSAFEQAKKLAAQTQENQDTTPLGQWREKMIAVYTDFSRRRDPEQWKELLKDDVAFSLASRPQALDTMLTYFMEEYYLPHVCWLVLEDFFGILAQKEDLAERYPEKFLENIVYSGIENTNYLPYEYFNDCHGCEPDDYLHQFFKTNHLINRGDLDEGLKELDILENLPAKHPFTEMLHIQVLMRQSNYDRAFARANALFSDYPDNDVIQIITGDCARLSENLETAISIYSTLLDTIPNHYQARVGRAMCYSTLEKWKDAADDYDKLLERYPSTSSLRQQQSDVYKKWADQLKQESGPLTNRQILDLVWAQIEIDDYDDALTHILTVTPENNDELYETENSLGNIYMALDKYDLALEHAIKWEQSIRNIPENTQDTEQKRKLSRLPRSFSMQAMALYELGRKEEAHKTLEKAIELIPDEPDIWRIKGVWHSRERQYEEAAQCAKKLCQLLPNDSIGFSLLAMAQYNMIDFADAYANFDEAIARDASKMDFYVMKFRILIARRAKDEAMQLITHLKEHSAPENDVAFLERYWTLRFVEDKEQVEKAEQEIIQMTNEPKLGNCCMDLLYYCASICDCVSRKEQFEFVKKGLEYRNPDIDLMCRYTWLAIEIDLYPEAIKMAEESLELYPHITNQKYRLAYAYAQVGRYADSAQLYHKLGESEKDADDIYLAGLYYYYANMHKESRPLIEKALEMNDTLFRTHRIIALHERDAGNEDECIAAVRRAIATIPADAPSAAKAAQYRMLYQLLSHFGRTEEAFKAALDCARLDEKFGSYSNADEMYENAHQWDKAFTAREEYFILNKLKKLGDQQPLERILLTLRQGDAKKAASLAGRMRFHKKDENHYRTFALCHLANGNLKKAYENWKNLFKEDSFMAQNPVFLWMLHDMKMTEDLDKILVEKKAYYDTWYDVAGQQRMKDTALCNTYLFLGEIDKIDPLLEQTEKFPLCPGCEYDICKDVLEVMAHRCEMQGDYEKALEYWQNMYDKYASDETIVLHMIRIKNKMQEKKAL